MKCGYRKKSAILFIGLFVVFGSTQALAAQINIGPDDTEVWLHEDQDREVNGTATCSSGYNPSSLEITTPDSAIIQKGVSDGKFVHQLSTNDPSGQYTLSLRCESNSDSKTAEETFSALRLTASRTSPESSLNVYKGEKVPVEAEIAVEGSNTRNFNLGRADFEMTLYDQEPVSLEEIEKMRSGSGQDVFRVKGRVPEGVETGSKFLETTIDYNAPNSENDISIPIEGFSLTVDKPWSFEVVNKTPDSSVINFENSHKISLGTFVRYKGEPKNKLSSSDFYLTVLDSEGNVVRNIEKKEWVSSDLQNSEGRYKLSMSQVPSLSIGEYQWIIGLERDEGIQIANLPVYNYMFLSGNIYDAQGQGVNAEILVEGDSATTKSLDVDEGSYRGRVLPDTYNFTVEFPELTSTFENVELRPGVKGTIRYDEIPHEDIQGTLEGISVVNSVGVVFGYPLEEARMDMSYDPSQVSFDNARVVECQRWNLVKRNCWGEWETLNESEVTLYPTVGRAVFETEPINISKGREKIMSAYMVVRNTELTLDSFGLSAGRYAAGSTQDVSGKVVTPSGQGVGGVDVNVSFINGGSLAGTTVLQTDANGNFGSPISMPEEAGIYTVRIEADKDPYQGFETALSGNVETYIEKSVSVQVPESVTFNPGETSRTSFNVVNTGQVEAKDAKIRIKGLKNTWYEFEPNSWSSITPGGSKEAVMSTELPEDYCGEQCTQYPQFKVEVVAKAGGEALNDIKTVQSVVEKRNTQNNSQSSQTTTRNAEADSSFGVPSMPSTGKFLERRSSLNIALALATVFIVALAASVKKKKSSGSSDRGGRRNGGRGGRSGRSRGNGMQKPDVSAKPTVEEAEEEESEQTDELEVQEDEETQESEAESEGEESDGNKCDVCGEEFDTESGLELHRQAMH